MIPPENEEWDGVWFPGLFYFLFYFYIYLFSSLNDELDKHKEKIKKITQTAVINIVFQRIFYMT